MKPIDDNWQFAGCVAKATHVHLFSAKSSIVYVLGGVHHAMHSLSAYLLNMRHAWRGTHVPLGTFNASNSFSRS